jgi:hypothetical protein
MQLLSYFDMVIGTVGTVGMFGTRLDQYHFSAIHVVLMRHSRCCAVNHDGATKDPLAYVGDWHHPFGSAYCKFGDLRHGTSDI